MPRPRWRGAIPYRFRNGESSGRCGKATAESRHPATITTLAITGGTGSYESAGGHMTLHARNAKGTEYDFTYEVEK